jgi:microtubule-associated protein-like 6
VSIDWNKDKTKKYLAVSTSSNQIKFFDLNDLESAPLKNKPITTSTNPAVASTQEWASYTCRQGWGSQGIHGPNAGVTSVSRSHNQNFMATSDKAGLVKLFKYPSLYENSEFKQYSGHSSRAAHVSFSYDDKYLISVGGGLDRSVLVYATDFQGSKAKQGELKLKQSEFKAVKDELESDLMDTTKSCKNYAKDERRRMDAHL